MHYKRLHKSLTFFIAAVWFVNGFFCKLLDMVPRHELIVSRTLGPQFAMPLTKIIGALEVLMSVWIVSRIMPRINAITQIMVIATMNALEFFLVPDLLLWGKGNAVFAFLLIMLIAYNGFYLNRSAASEL
jgi:hypothetical protein